MGACGCGEIEPDFKFKGQDNTIYFLTIYTGCHYCSTPAGIIIQKSTPESLKDHDEFEFELEHMPELKFHTYDGKLAKENESGEFVIPLFFPENFIKKLSKLCGSVKIDDENLALDEIIDSVDYYSAAEETIFETVYLAYETSKKLEERLGTNEEDI